MYQNEWKVIKRPTIVPAIKQFWSCFTVNPRFWQPFCEISQFRVHYSKENQKLPVKHRRRVFNIKIYFQFCLHMHLFMLSFFLSFFNIREHFWVSVLRARFGTIIQIYTYWPTCSDAWLTFGLSCLTCFIGDLMMTLLWYYQPEHTEAGRLPHHLEVTLKKNHEEQFWLHPKCCTKSTIRLSISTIRLSISTIRLSISTIRLSISTIRLSISTIRLSISTIRLSISTIRLSISTIHLSISKICY